MSTEREDWLAKRRRGIGASEAAAIFGLSSYTSPLQLYHEKIGTLPQSAAQTEAQKWGKLLEPAIIEGYAEETHRIVTRMDEYTIVQHPEHPWMLATLDARVLEWVPTELFAGEDAGRFPGPGALEVKNATFFKREDWKREPPLAFQIQLQHQLACAGLRWGSIAGLIGGMQFVWTDVPRDDEFCKMLVDAERVFWQSVEERREPEADASEKTKELLKRLYPRDVGTIIELPPVADEVDALRQHAIAQLDKWGERRTQAENRLRQLLGDATMGTLRNGVAYTLKTISRRGYEVKPTSYRLLGRRGPKGEIGE